MSGAWGSWQIVQTHRDTWSVVRLGTPREGVTVRAEGWGYTSAEKAWAELCLSLNVRRGTY